ncbi:hypothetical protein FOZ60_000623 [Perkinsus olseni]|uniref:Uncharacterized protein n=1 Tax=Perkinsus olseni TaxID=32597 RepID=A0A7J6MZL5_PEROL|nr:hypothetical protein FOZ60_000623 [Perkinsus olseni]
MTDSTIKVRFNWLHRGLLLLAYTAVMALSNESYTVLADHPPGCNGGPGSASTSDDIEVLDELGDYGTLKLQWNMVESDTSPTGFSMEASGDTQLSLGTDEVSLRLALGPSDMVTYDDNEGKFVVKTYSHVLAYFNEALHEHANLATAWHYLEGSADDSGFSLYSPLVRADAVASAGHSYSTRHALVVTQLSHDGYHIRFSFGAKGTYVTSEGVQRSLSIDKDIVEGALYYQYTL